MKRLFILLTLTLLVTACGSVNENIKAEMHGDVEQVLTTIETSLEMDREPTSEEWETFNEYKEKYDSMLSDGELSDDERLLDTLVEGLISKVDNKQSLDSADKRLKGEIEEIRTFMKKGEY